MTNGQRWRCVGIVCVLIAVAGRDVRAEADLIHGPECLYTALLALDVDPGTYTDFLDRVGNADADATTISRLAALAAEFGVSTLAVETSLENLERRQAEPPFVCIARMDDSGFVLIGDVDDNAVWTVNPPGEGLVAARLFEQRWSGQALLLSRSPLLPDERLPRRRAGVVYWLVVVGGLVVTAGVGWRLKYQRRNT